MTPSRGTPAQTLPVLRAAHFLCVDGANMGDGLSFADELMLDDSYELTDRPAPEDLRVQPRAEAAFGIAPDSPLGQAGAALHLDSAVMFMAPDGAFHEAILLVEVTQAGAAAAVFVLPLTAFRPRTEYRLVGIDRQGARQKFAQAACVSFTRGTRITLPSGAQRRIEELQPGDRILTRDNGVQQIRWIGQNTVRAVGEFAPIRIRAGTLNNAGDLTVSPDHRLFIYQRRDAVGAGRAELMVKARHLVNGDSVTVQEGGFVEYFQLLLDSHQIIYAEGIAAETMLVDTRTQPVLPEEISAALGDLAAGHSDLSHAGLDVSEALLRRPDAAEILRKASAR
jgi:hypothetical protein